VLPSSELRHFCEVKVSNLHGRHDHVEGFLAAGAHEFAHSFHVRQHVNQAFVEAEVAYARLDFSILDQKSAVARHAGENLLVGIDLADVPQSRHQHTPVG